MKVKTRIDCIEPEQSFAKRPFWSSEPPRTFAELATTIELGVEVAKSFANRGSSTYFAYPGAGVQRISLNYSVVPEGMKLFEPMYWPQYLVIDEAFARELEDVCRGGTSGYYFWTLGFDDVSNEFNKTMQALR